VTTPARDALAKAIDEIEGAYEFFLAYAAQGLGHESEGSPVEAQLRGHLGTMRGAVHGLGALLGHLLDEDEGPAPDRLRAFRELLTADAGRAGVVLDLVDAQPFATSQLVDNLNASLHVRTLLTDLFLLDEALRLGVDVSTAAAGGGKTRLP
jgi:hypothetical protein